MKVVSFGSALVLIEERIAFCPLDCHYQREQFLPRSLPPLNDASVREQSARCRPVTYPCLYSPEGVRDLNHSLLGAPLKLIESLKTKAAHFIQEALSKN
jgi:hypothetical protein